MSGSDSNAPIFAWPPVRMQRWSQSSKRTNVRRWPTGAAAFGEHPKRRRRTCHVTKRQALGRLATSDLRQRIIIYLAPSRDRQLGDQTVGPPGRTTTGSILLLPLRLFSPSFRLSGERRIIRDSLSCWTASADTAELGQPAFTSTFSQSIATYCTSKTRRYQCFRPLDNLADTVGARFATSPLVSSSSRLTT